MKIYLRTFGCRANHADSEAVRTLLLGAGHEVVSTADAADVAVFNSCAVTADAEADLRQAVRRVARRSPGMRSVVMGCVAGLPDRESTLRALPGVTDVIPGADLPRIASALDLAPSPIRVTIPQRSTRALLRIQDGCDEHCTFCTTTLARGANRSRAAEDLVREAASLAVHHSEIVLTGIHIGTYGTDISSSLGALVERLVRDVPDVRFRLTSVEATEVDAQLAELLVGDARRVAPSLHAPLQSGSDRVLRRMGRHWYSAERYAVALENLAARAPVFGLGADVIAGFPGETADDHAATIALCERIPFTYLHVFPYSPRPGTSAERLGDGVPPCIAARRAEELRELAARKHAAYVVSRAGGRSDVIVVGEAHKRGGLTEDYLTVGITNPYLPRGHRYTAMLHLVDGSLVAS